MMGEEVGCYRGFWQFCFFVVLLFLVFHFSVAFGSQGSGFYFPKTTEILHFQISTFQGINTSIEHDYGRIYQMDNNSPPSSFFATGSIGFAFFATLPLNASLVVSNVTLFIYHEPAARVYMIFGYFDVNGNACYYYNNSAPSPPGNATDEITFSPIDMQLQQGQRLLVAVRVGADGPGPSSEFYFGDSDHDSWLQYIGTTTSVPEFPQVFLALLIFAAGLITIASSKKPTAAAPKRRP